jgi:hypothetical protein
MTTWRRSFVREPFLMGRRSGSAKVTLMIAPCKVGVAAKRSLRPDRGRCAASLNSS